jgi:hypothetical protein
VSGVVRDGTLHMAPRERQALQEAVRTWRKGPVTVTVERQHATRSAQANAYYWSVVVKALSEYTGYTPDETHELLKRQFLPKELAVTGKNGRLVAEFVIGGSTAKLNGLDFFDYVEVIRLWAFEELEVSIPPPDPEWPEHAVEDPNFAGQEPEKRIE